MCAATVVLDYTIHFIETTESRRNKNIKAKQRIKIKKINEFVVYKMKREVCVLYDGI